MSKRPIQELADARLAPEYRQPVKTIQEACEAIGWEFADRPVCCGSEVEISSFIGQAYQAVCRKRDKFIFDVTGPEYSNGGGVIELPQEDAYDLDGAARWVAGQRAAEKAA